MSKPGGKPIQRPRPFVSNELFSILVTRDELKRVTGFVVVANGKTTVIDATKSITKAWQKVETIVDPLAYQLIKKKK